MHAPEYTDYLKTINQTFQDQIKTADQKAAYILTFLIALLVWSADMRKIFFWMNRADALTLKWVLSLVLVLALSFALICAVLVLVPRNRAGGVALYWAAWPSAGEKLARAAQANDLQFIVTEYTVNLEHLADICRRKYRCVGFAFRGFIIALICHLALLAIG